MPGDRRPFRSDEMSDEQAAAAYHGKHSLRDMYTRDNVERRRIAGHTLRRFLTVAQDRQFLAKAIKVRDEYDVHCNDDVVIVLAQQWLAEGKDDVDPKLAEIAKAANVAKRTTPFEPEKH